MNNGRYIPSWTVAVILWICAVSFAGSESVTSTEAQRHFEKANELRKLEDYTGAIAEYQKVLSLSPDDTTARNAHYWIGQAHFEARQLDAALSAFQGLLDKYPASSIGPATREMIERVQQAQKNKALFEAVKKTDVEHVRLLLARGAEVDAKWGDTQEKANTADDTPLCYAVDANSMDLVKLLVEAGAGVNAGKWPPLCRAVDKNNTAIAEYLIDHGANVNVEVPRGWTALCETINVSNSSKMAGLLITRGADINAGYWPPITSSVREKRIDLLKFLIQRGADVNNTDNWGYTPLYFAVHNDDLDYLKALIAHGAELDTKHPGGETALMSGAFTGRTEAVKLLLEAGADINAKNDRGQTALHVPLDIRTSNSDCLQYQLPTDTIELLLAKGADVNLKDEDGRTPLHLAAESADGDIVKLLLDKGAKIDEKDDESGFTALHYAARLGNKDAAELLIARGADVNAKDKQGHTPLCVADNHDYKVAELLINKGADSAIRTESHRTLLQLAQERKQIESTVPDLRFDGDPNSRFGESIVRGDVDGDGYDDILIGAPRYNNERGRVHLFYGGPDMDTTSGFIFEGQNAGDAFGASIACGDIDHDGYEDIIVGACRYSTNQGRAYLFWGSDRNSMDADPDKVFTGEEKKGSSFGAGLPAVYDIDNDGYDDIILTASNRGYLYYGNTKELMDASADLILKQEDPGYSFGYTISCGDVDNDGFGDIVVGPWWSRQGRAYLFYGGGRLNMDAKADVIFKAQSEGDDYFGQGIVCVDQNRDGYDDIIMGAAGYNDMQGRSYLFYGSSKRSLDTDPDMTFNGEVEGGLYGGRPVCYGDIDGDKVNDIVIGAYLYRQQIGRVYVYWGKDLSAPNPKPGRILTGENPGDCFGVGLACGDVNNDGFDDLVIGAHFYRAGAKQGPTYQLRPIGNPPRYRVEYKGGPTPQGRVYLYYGGPRKK